MIQKVLADPKRMMRLAPKVLLQRCTRYFHNTSFRLQGQMDIHPLSRWHDVPFVERFGGFQLNGSHRDVLDLEPWDSVRRDMLILLLRDVLERNLPGEIAELGVYEGSTAKLIHHYAPEKRLHLYDTFAGFDQRDIKVEATANSREVASTDFSRTSVERVRQHIAPKNDNVFFHPGFFPESVPASLDGVRYCFVHLDADLYAPILAGLEYFYSRMERGGLIVIHDYNSWPGARQATMDFFSDKGDMPIPMPDKSGSAVVRVTNNQSSPQN